MQTRDKPTPSFQSEAYCSLRIDKEPESADVEGWDYCPQRKQLVADPERNDLMHRFIDKFAALMEQPRGDAESEEKPAPAAAAAHGKPKASKGTKRCKPPLGRPPPERGRTHEEGLSILAAIQASQSKQRLQKQTNYIIDNEPEEEYAKTREKYSQSVIVAPPDALGSSAAKTESGKASV